MLPDMRLSESKEYRNSIKEFRILFIQPVLSLGETNKKSVFASGIEIPLSLLYLSAFCEKKDLISDVIDLRLHNNPAEALKEKIKEFDPAIVGITAFTCEIESAHETAKIVKEINDTIPTVIGGIHASALPINTITQYPAFDIVVIGEGENTIYEIACNMQKNEDIFKIPGICFQHKGETSITKPREFIQDLDEIPFPNRHKVDIHKYKPNIITGNYLSLPTTGIIAGRGCPYGCYHCSKGVWGKTIRYRRARNIMSEIKHCIETFGIHDFRFFDDILTLKNGPIYELCELIIESGLKITFNCYSRLDQIDEKLLKLMKNAGCYHIKYGVEFGTEKALTISNRRTTLEQAQNIIPMTKKLGIITKGNFMMGIPGETVEDIEKTIDFAKKLSPDLVSFGLFQLFPGSRFHKEVVEKRNKEMEKNILPKEVVIPLISKGYRAFYFRISYIYQRLKMAFQSPKTFIREIKILYLGFITLVAFFLRRIFDRA